MYSILFNCVKNFAKRFYRDGYARGCGGCTYFLAIMYLDHLKQIPAEWGVFPHIRVWTTKLVNAAKKEIVLIKAVTMKKLGALILHMMSNILTWLGIQWGPQSMALEVANLVLQQIGMGNDRGRGEISMDMQESDEEEKDRRKRRCIGPVDKLNPRQKEEKES